MTHNHNIDKNEFIRLVLQSLRDLNLSNTFSSLAQESGIELETDIVTKLRNSILQGNWLTSINLIDKLNLDYDSALRSKIILNRQHYLESLEHGDDRSAIDILRHSLVPLIQESDPDQVQLLSSWLMCSSPAELRQRADWDGSNMMSRSKLLDSLQSYIKPSMMLPQSRLFTLLNQAKLYQLRNNRYSNIDEENLDFSLLHDYQQDNSAFPNFNSLTVKAHTDEIWHCCFSHNGKYLATASRDKSIALWEIDSLQQTFKKHKRIPPTLEDITALTWSHDDTRLLTAAENIVYIYDTMTGNCLNSYQQEHEHEETISSLIWSHDDSKFYSTGLDQRVVEWNSDGSMLHKWENLPIRIMDSALSPDQRKLVVAGPDGPQPTMGPDGTLSYSEEMRHLMVYDTETRSLLWQVEMKNEIGSLAISSDSSRVAVNYAPDEIQIWSLEDRCLVQKLYGYKQSQHVIRSCFGGYNDNFILSGSEDASIYVWHHQSGELIEILEGHDTGCVNSVAWSPTMPLICSVGDDRTIRLWSTRTDTSRHSEINMLKSDIEDNFWNHVEDRGEVDDDLEDGADEGEIDDDDHNVHMSEQ
ncbi:hypothetical protein E3P99_03577 [Wallemia hederae]|uniref:CTLH domain-containing protein n=1 Tax=Wallemia hederae TaxID=1540922 RepID=A0A4T0FES1_9BASI|nr:hypothetical protein E3P99_03577 [Wallemia hederae]